MWRVQLRRSPCALESCLGAWALGSLGYRALWPPGVQYGFKVGGFSPLESAALGNSCTVVSRQH
jgi:hypothetical protein